MFTDLLKRKPRPQDLNQAGGFVNISVANDFINGLKAELAATQTKLAQFQTKQDNTAQVEAYAEKLLKENAELKSIIRVMAEAGSELEAKLKAQLSQPATTPAKPLSAFNRIEQSIRAELEKNNLLPRKK